MDAFQNNTPSQYFYQHDLQSLIYIPTNKNNPLSDILSIKTYHDNICISSLHIRQVFLELTRIISLYFIERHSKNMKFTSSLLTSSTKQTFLNSMNDQPRRPQEPITIFTRKDGKVYRLAVPLEDKTINELLLDVIHQFNADHGLNLNSDTSSFLLYAAKKNGKICSDYPAFEPTQNVILTKVFHFYLKQRPLKPQQPRILTTFSNQPKSEVKVQQQVFCSCLFSSRK